MQNEMGKSLQEYVVKLGGTASGAAESMQQSARQAAPSQGAEYNPMAGMFSVWESAFQEAAALARNNMAGAQAATNQMMAEAGKFPGTGGGAPGTSAPPAAAPGVSGATVGSESADERRGGPKRK